MIYYSRDKSHCAAAAQITYSNSSQRWEKLIHVDSTASVLEESKTFQQTCRNRQVQAFENLLLQPGGIRKCNIHELQVASHLSENRSSCVIRVNVRHSINHLEYPVCSNLCLCEVLQIWKRHPQRPATQTNYTQNHHHELFVHQAQSHHPGSKAFTES